VLLKLRETRALARHKEKAVDLEALFFFDLGRVLKFLDERFFWNMPLPNQHES